MSLQAALQFIQTIRQDESLRNKIEHNGQHLSFSNVVALGNEAGFACTADELRRAFKHDWAMRWIRYNTHDTQGDTL